MFVIRLTRAGAAAGLFVLNVVEADKTPINMRGAGFYVFGPIPIDASG